MGVSGVQGFEFEIGGHGFEGCKYGSLMMMMMVNLAKCSSRMVVLYFVYIIGNSCCLLQSMN